MLGAGVIGLTTAYKQGVKFAVPGSNARVHLPLSISVRDNGPGIPATDVPRLFNEPFTTKAPGQGTGLGLGSVKELVTAAKGAIRLTTKPGQGSTFTVFLPLAS